MGTAGRGIGDERGSPAGRFGALVAGLVRERVRPPFQLAGVRALASTRYQRRWACRRGRTPADGSALARRSRLRRSPARLPSVLRRSDRQPRTEVEGAAPLPPPLCRRRVSRIVPTTHRACRPDPLPGSRPCRLGVHWLYASLRYRGARWSVLYSVDESVAPGTRVNLAAWCGARSVGAAKLEPVEVVQISVH